MGGTEYRRLVGAFGRIFTATNWNRCDYGKAKMIHRSRLPAEVRSVMTGISSQLSDEFENDIVLRDEGYIDSALGVAA